MNATNLTLLIPDKPDPERAEVATQFERAGGRVLRLARFWSPPTLDPAMTRVYGPDTFCLVLRETLGLTLHAPPDDLLTTLPYKLTDRSIVVRRVHELASLGYPVFLKSSVPKLVAARVCEDEAQAQRACQDLPAETPLLVSEIVQMEREYRAFVLGGRVLDCALYEGEGAEQGERDQAIVFATWCASAIEMEHGYVLDVAVTAGRWMIVEANAAWGAGLNGCRADRVIGAIASSSAPSEATRS